VVYLVHKTKTTKTADKLFDRYEYVDAAKEYLKLTEKKADNYVYKQLADSYYNVLNTKEAVKWFAKATAKGKARCRNLLSVCANLESFRKIPRSKQANGCFC
jgi:hypothetical protein